MLFRASAAAQPTPSRNTWKNAAPKISNPCLVIAARNEGHPHDLVENPIELHSADRSSGTSPNFRISLASPNSPVAGSPLRLNAIAPTWPGLRDKASAFITAAFGLK